jgi:transposase
MKRLRLASMETQAAGQQRPVAGEHLYLGIDLSRTKWVYALRWGGELRRRWSSPYGLEHVKALVGEYEQCVLHVAYEACGFGYEVAWWLEEQGIAVTVAAPSRIERPPGPRVKTDRIDANKLAEKLEKGVLKPSYVPRRREHERRQFSRTYEQALIDRKRAQVRLRSLMQQHGRIGPAQSAGWPAYKRWIEEQTLPTPLAECVRELFAMRSAASTSVERLKHQLLMLAKAPEYAPIVHALHEQPGVGRFTAIRLVLELGDMAARFPTTDSFPHYLGLTPGEYSSGDFVRRGHILKGGPDAIRRWLLQCAWANIRIADPDPGLAQCFHRLAPMVGRKRAIVAVARRLSRRIRARWLESLSAVEARA